MNHQQAMLALDDFFLGASINQSSHQDDCGGQDTPVKEAKTFKDYVKVYCGDRKLANYWYTKHNPQK